VVFIGDPDVEPRVLRKLYAAVQRVEGDRGEAEALGGGLQEIVAMRVIDQMLPRILDRRLVRAFASEIVRQIEWADDLIEELRVSFCRLRHRSREENKTASRLSYFRRAAGRAQRSSARAGTMVAASFSVVRITVSDVGIPT